MGLKGTPSTVSNERPSGAMRIFGNFNLSSAASNNGKPDNSKKTNKISTLIFSALNILTGQGQGFVGHFFW
jgi:hypothetical protein